MTRTVERILTALAGTHELYEPPGLVERYTAWVSGRDDPAFAYIVATAKSSCGDVALGLGDALYYLHVIPPPEDTPETMATSSAAKFEQHCRTVKDWAYREGAIYARYQRKGRGFPDFKLPWARQACRDGLFLVLWDHLRRGGLEVKPPGLEARAEQFDVSRRQYQRIRDAIKREAQFRLDNFRARLTVLNAIDLSGKIE